MSHLRVIPANAGIQFLALRVTPSIPAIAKTLDPGVRRDDDVRRA
jgi:hypothetical protein